MAETGDYGGECVAYAANYFGKRFGVLKASQIWKADSVTQLSGPESGSCACWSGGSGGYGHVGVVEEWDSSSETMRYSDSNYDYPNKLVIVRDDITEKDMKALFGRSYKFQGYVKFKD